jgi:hypothetical protein
MRARLSVPTHASFTHRGTMMRLCSGKRSSRGTASGAIRARACSGAMTGKNALRRVCATRVASCPASARALGRAMAICAASTIAASESWIATRLNVAPSSE